MSIGTVAYGLACMGGVYSKMDEFIITQGEKRSKQQRSFFLVATHML